jgi:hypothetical protein
MSYLNNLCVPAESKSDEYWDVEETDLEANLGPKNPFPSFSDTEYSDVDNSKSSSWSESESGLSFEGELEYPEA